MAAVDVLRTLGFEDGDVAQWQAYSDSLGLSENYPHKVLYAGSKDGVTAVIEQNVSEDESGGVPVIMKHPAILILANEHGGRVAISNHDDPNNGELIANVVADLAG